VPPLILLTAVATLAASLQLAQAPYVASPPDVVDRMLRLARVGPDDVVYDLGSGDGRVVIAAALKFGARGVGIEIDPERVEQARTNAARANVEHLVMFRQEDVMEANLSEATVVTLYLLTAQNIRLRPRLTAALRPGARIVSHNFAMGDWTPEIVDTFTSADGQSRTLYRWTADGVLRP
jgi:tRNA A58 N-methylase Trm61